MKFVVVMVCLNAANTIEASLESVLRAGPIVDRLLIVDGGSTDGTVRIIEGYQHHFGPRMSWTSKPDKGLYYAMNAGLERVEGSCFVLFLGADDELIPGALEIVAQAAGDDVDLVFGDVVTVEPNGTERIERGCRPSKSIASMPRSMPICHQASLYSARAYRALGGFNTGFTLAADYEFYLRFIEAGMKSAYVPTAIARFRLGGMSSSLGIATADEYRRAWILHGVHPWRARISMMRSLAGLSVMRPVRWIRSRMRS